MNSYHDHPGIAGGRIYPHKGWTVGANSGDSYDMRLNAVLTCYFPQMF